MSDHNPIIPVNMCLSRKPAFGAAPHALSNRLCMVCFWHQLMIEAVAVAKAQQTIISLLVLVTCWCTGYCWVIRRQSIERAWSDVHNCVFQRSAAFSKSGT
jgi:hypothetical protein